MEAPRSATNDIRNNDYELMKIRAAGKRDIGSQSAVTPCRRVARRMGRHGVSFLLILSGHRCRWLSWAAGSARWPVGKPYRRPPAPVAAVDDDDDDEFVSDFTFASSFLTFTHFIGVVLEVMSIT